MQLECYKIYDIAPEIVPGRSTRDWMDAFPDRQPYRCLPLSMANSTGWEILCPMDIKIKWNGGPGKNDITLKTRGDPRAIASFADSHFQRMYSPDSTSKTSSGFYRYRHAGPATSCNLDASRAEVRRVAC